MKSISLFLAVVLLSVSTQGQTTFKKIIASDNNETAYSILQTNDGGFAVCGKITIQGESFCYLLRTDEYGDTIWTKKYPGNPQAYESIFKQTSDNGFIICSSLTGINGTSINLIRTNSIGDTLWTRVIPQTKGNAIEIAPDHGFIIAGQSNTNSIVIKTDDSGNTLWSKNYYPMGITTAYSYATSICNTSDNGYLLCGNSDHSPSYFNTFNIFSIKLDNNGDSTWGRIYDDLFYQNVFSVHQTTDNDYILGGFLDSLGLGGHAYEYVIKTTEQGDKIWTYTSPLVEFGYLLSLHEIPAGGFIACGGALQGTDSYILIEKISSNGTMEWRRSFTDWIDGEASSVRPTSDGGFVLCGTIKEGLPTDYDIIIIKTDSTGILTGLNDGIFLDKTDLHIFPNPSTSLTHLTYELLSYGTIQIDLLNNSGEIVKMIFKDESSTGKHQLLVDLNYLSPGIYYFRLIFKESVEIQKLIVIK